MGGCLSCSGKVKEDDQHSVELNRDCLSHIFDLLSTKEIAASVIPVCKEWRDLGWEATERVFRFNKENLCTQNCEMDVASLELFIQRRARSLEVFILKAAMGFQRDSAKNIKRVLEAASLCSQLKVLEIKAYVYASTTCKKDLTAVPPGLYGPRGISLPAGLKVLRLNFTANLALVTYKTKPNSLEVLEAPKIDLQPGSKKTCQGLHALITTLVSHDLHMLDGLKHLQMLSLDFNSRKSLPNWFWSLTLNLAQLKHLFCYRISEMNSGSRILKDHPALDSLSIDVLNCSPENAEDLFSLPQLTYLTIGSLLTPGTDFPKPDMRNSKLKRLVISSGNFRVCNEALQQAPNLDYVWITGLPPSANIKDLHRDILHAILVKGGENFQKQIRDHLQAENFIYTQRDICPPDWLLFEGLLGRTIFQTPVLMFNDNREDRIRAFLDCHIKLGN